MFGSFPQNTYVPQAANLHPTGDGKRVTLQRFFTVTGGTPDLMSLFGQPDTWINHYFNPDPKPDAGQFGAVFAIRGSDTGSGGLGSYKVALYSSANSGVAGDTMYASNSLIQLNAGHTMVHGSGYEVDVNNLAGDESINTLAAVGLHGVHVVSGGTHKPKVAYSVTAITAPFRIAYEVHTNSAEVGFCTGAPAGISDCRIDALLSRPATSAGNSLDDVHIVLSNPSSIGQTRTFWYTNGVIVAKDRVDYAGGRYLMGAASVNLCVGDDLGGASASFAITSAGGSVSRSNSDPSPASNHLILDNSSSTGQIGLLLKINGTMRGRIRADYVGNMNWVANGGSHNFYLGGDFDTGSVGVQLTAGGVEVLANGGGLILKSPDGTRYRISVANGGTLTATGA